MQKLNPEGNVCPWDPPRISLLDEVLKELPPSFYSPPQEMMSFILWLGNGMARRKTGEPDSFRGSCSCEVKNESDAFPPAAIFVKRDMRTLKPFDLTASKKLIAHELGHNKTLSKDNLQDGRNTTIDKAMEAIGLPPPSVYSQPNPDLINAFKKHVDISATTEGRGEQVFMKESDLLGTSIIPREFIANAAEFFFLGHQQFIKTFAPDLGEKFAENLYQFMKKNIFEGIEYSNGFRLS